MRRVLVAILVSSVLANFVPGCLFEPRDVEPPEVDNVQYAFPSEPSVVWDNAEKALENLHSPGWEDVIDENFVYVPDSDTENAYPAVDWLNWNAEIEISFINRFFTSVSAIEADLYDTEWETGDPSGGQAEWEITYFLEVTDQAGSVTQYRGRAIIHFILAGNSYVLDRWEDLHGEPHPDTEALLPSMGGIRGAFASK